MNTPICKDLTYQDCELAILRMNVNKLDYTDGVHVMAAPETQTILRIVEEFIISEKCIVYGGTAVNNILPKKDQFYNYKFQIPDYDFYSPKAKEHAIQLVDLYLEQGFIQVEAKPSMHPGTYKVFVNAMGVADITQLHPDLYTMFYKHGISRKLMKYAPINILRQAMYLELSRPLGNRTRWEKVLTRLNLLNKYYPMKQSKCDQRIFTKSKVRTDTFAALKAVFTKHDVLYIGAYANAIYTNHTDIPSLDNIPDFDVVSLTPKETAQDVFETLLQQGFNASIEYYEPLGELISEHFAIKIKDEYVAFIYAPMACHGYNLYKKMKIATIDTLLSFYLAFMYADRPYYDMNRLMCLSTALFKVQQHNRLEQKGVFKRFGKNCFGTQVTQNMLREARNQAYQHRNSLPQSYVDKYIFRYPPFTKKKKMSTTSSSHHARHLGKTKRKST
jgi:hypothetical protein